MSRTVSLLNRFPDPETSNDPKVRALVEQLSALDYAPAPRPEFRSELRAQLVAITPRLVSAEHTVVEAEPAGPATLDPVKAARAARAEGLATVTKLATPDSRTRRRVGRPLGLAAACCAVLALGLGGAVWKSRSALPGDSLYGLKRASERVQLSLTSGDTARGHEYLALATTRVQEARDLLGQNSAMASGSGIQAGGLSPETVSLIRSTLRSANSDLTSGSSLLGTEAVQSHSASPLSIMTGWAPSQLKQLNELATAIGSGPAHSSTLHSWTLVHTALIRARTLKPEVAHCTAAHSDRFGPTKCSNSGHRAPSAKTHSKSTSRPNAHRSTPNSHPATSSPNGTGTHHTKHSAGRGSSRPGSSSNAPAGPTSAPTKLPKLVPSTLPSLPVSVDSCGISAQVGPIGVKVGGCPTGS